MALAAIMISQNNLLAQYQGVNHQVKVHYLKNKNTKNPINKAIIKIAKNVFLKTAKKLSTSAKRTKVLNGHAFNNIGVIHALQKHHIDMIKPFENALDNLQNFKQADYTYLMYNLYQALLLSNDTQNLSRALQMSSNITSILGKHVNYNKAWNLYELGMMDEAYKLYSVANSSAYNDQYARFNYALLAYISGDYFIAKHTIEAQNFKKQMQKNANTIYAGILTELYEPDSAFKYISYNNVSNSFYNYCNYINSAAAIFNISDKKTYKYNQVLRKNKENIALANTTIANAYYATANYNDAIRYYNLALRDSLSTSILCNMGNAHLLSNEYDSAYLYFSKALDIDPNYWFAQACMMHYYYIMNDNNAVLYASNISNKIPAKKHYYDLICINADVFLKAGYSNLAKVNFIKAKRIDSTRYEAFSGIAQIYFNQNSFDTAIYYINKAIISQQIFLLCVQVHYFIKVIKQVIH